MSGTIPRSLTSSIYITTTFQLIADMVDRYAFTAPTPLTLLSISEVHSVPESIGTLGIMPTRCQGTEAVASGDPLLSAGFDGLGAAATVQNGTLLTTAVVNFDAGDRLGIDFTGDVAGELAGVCITARFIARQ